jgi:hypothetical protein
MSRIFVNYRAEDYRPEPDVSVRRLAQLGLLLRALQEARFAAGIHDETLTSMLVQEISQPRSHGQFSGFRGLCHRTRSEPEDNPGWVLAWYVAVGPRSRAFSCMSLVGLGKASSLLGWIRLHMRSQTEFGSTVPGSGHQLSRQSLPGEDHDIQQLGPVFPRVVDPVKRFDALLHSDFSAVDSPSPCSTAKPTGALDLGALWQRANGRMFAAWAINSAPSVPSDTVALPPLGKPSKWVDCFGRKQPVAACRTSMHDVLAAATGKPCATILGAGVHVPSTEQRSSSHRRRKKNFVSRCGRSSFGDVHALARTRQVNSWYDFASCNVFGSSAAMRRHSRPPRGVYSKQSGYLSKLFAGTLDGCTDRAAISRALLQWAGREEFGEPGPYPVEYFAPIGSRDSLSGPANEWIKALDHGTMAARVTGFPSPNGSPRLRSHPKSAVDCGKENRLEESYRFPLSHCLRAADWGRLTWLKPQVQPAKSFARSPHQVVPEARALGWWGQSH